MNNNIVGMETNMEQLLEKIMSVQSRSDGVNTSLFEKREHIEKLHRTRNFLRKVQFIYDLPSRLAKCIKAEAYADAVKYYTGALPIFKVSYCFGILQSIILVILHLLCMKFLILSIYLFVHCFCHLSLSISVFFFIIRHMGIHHSWTVSEHQKKQWLLL
nr:vacuolar protein sorting-associated protein 51 homolog isoform X1 [Ipomoea batatas]